VTSGARLLYSDAVRERWRRPRFRGTVGDGNAVAEDVNPLCGDRVRMTARVREGHVEEVRFTGDSCAICSASADVLAELAEGRSVTEAGAVEAADILEMLGTDVKPTRMRCVTLPIGVLRSALTGVV
jgi:nitrogen fixation NifU-like protein